MMKKKDITHDGLFFSFVGCVLALAYVIAPLHLLIVIAVLVSLVGAVIERKMALVGLLVVLALSVATYENHVTSQWHHINVRPELRSDFANLKPQLSAIKYWDDGILQLRFQNTAGTRIFLEEGATISRGLTCEAIDYEASVVKSGRSFVMTASGCIEDRSDDVIAFTIPFRTLVTGNQILHEEGSIQGLFEEGRPPYIAPLTVPLIMALTILNVMFIVAVAMKLREHENH